MSLNSSANIVSVLKQKMIDNKSQVEKYKEEIAEKENYFQVRFHFSISSWPSFLTVEELILSRRRSRMLRGKPRRTRKRSWCWRRS